MSHMSSHILEQLLDQLNAVFGQEAPLMVDKTKK